MNRITSLFCFMIVLFSCKEDEPTELSKEVLHGNWSGKSHIELFHFDSTFYRDSDHSLKLELFYGGDGQIIRTSGTKSINWVAESNPDLFIFSEKVSGVGGIDFYLTYIYEITSFDRDEFNLYKEDLYTENGVEYIRNTYWILSKDE